MELDDQFSEEGRMFAQSISNLMLANTASHLILESRYEAMLELLGTPPNASSVGQLSPETLRGLIEKMAEPHLDRKLAKLSDDQPRLVSVVHQMVEDFLPREID